MKQSGYEGTSNSGFNSSNVYVSGNLEEAASILVTQVYVDHLQQCLDFFIAHLIIVVLVSPTQVSMNPGETQT